MSRNVIHKLLVNANQLEWISYTVNRKATLAQEVKKDKRLRDMVIKLNDKLLQGMATPLEGDPSQFILGTSRVELKYIQQLADNTRAALVTKVIPNYADRIVKEPEHFKFHHDKAVKLADELTDLGNRIAKVL